MCTQYNTVINHLILIMSELIQSVGFPYPLCTGEISSFFVSYADIYALVLYLSPAYHLNSTHWSDLYLLQKRGEKKECIECSPWIYLRVFKTIEGHR